MADEERDRHKALFDFLIKAANPEDWRFPFEVEIVVVDPVTKNPMPPEAMRGLMEKFIEAIDFFHAAYAAVNVETGRTTKAYGAAGYASFDGYVLVVGSEGYQAW